MFTLRRISSSGVEMNQFLGNGYTLVDRESNYPEFCETFEKTFGYPHTADLDDTSTFDSKNVYAFVVADSIQPLYKKQKNFIMSDSGRTFDNLTYK